VGLFYNAPDPTRAGSGALCVLDSLFDFNAIYIVCLFISYAFPLILFSSLFPYLSFPLRIDPLCFQARCCKRRLNLGFVFVSFVSYVYFDWWSMLLLYSVFSTPSQQIGLVQHLWNELFCVKWNVKQQLNQSITPWCFDHIVLFVSLRAFGLWKVILWQFYRSDLGLLSI